MADPFLTAHLVAPLQFELGGRVWPVSIRDQMVRGQLFVRRAMREGLIGTTRPLLVVGAGAAGITAAVEATRRGVAAHVIEQLTAPFTRQAMCLTRWIDPTQYDWPHALSRTPMYPPYVPPMPPLPWPAARSAAIAARWRLTLRAAARPNLRITYGHQIAGATARGLMLRVFHGPPGGPSVHEDVGAMVSSIGFGTEDTQVGAFRGWRFWENDLLERPNAGVAVGHPVCVISGAGDGALQDFIRFVTGRRSAREIFALLPALPAWVTEDVAHIEDHAGRAHIWGTGPSDDHDILAWVHRAYVAVTQRLAADPAFWPQAVSNLDSLVPPERRSVRLAFSCTHFAKAYALNHLMVMLLATYLGEGTGARRVLFPGVRLDVIHPVPPHACGNPNGCHGQDHALHFLPNPDCQHPPLAGSARIPARRANVVVVRHGVRPPAYVYQGVAAPEPRQHLPYHLFA